MSHPRTSLQKQHALEMEVVALVKMDPHISDRQLADRLHVRRGRFPEIRKKHGLPSPHKTHAKSPLEPGANAYVDLRGIYLGAGFQIVVMVANNLQIEEADWSRMSQYLSLIHI